MTLLLTLNAIRERSPCLDGWTKLLRHIGKTVADDDPLSLATVLEANGLDDALWCLRAVDSRHDAAVRLLVCDLVEPSMRYVPAGETRPQEALRVSRAYARGEATPGELAAARDAARAAAEAARDAAGAAAEAAWAAAWAAARAAARDAARAARDAAGAAAEAAWAAARAAARDTQRRIFMQWINEMEKEPTITAGRMT